MSICYLSDLCTALNKMPGKENITYLSANMHVDIKCDQMALHVHMTLSVRSHAQNWVLPLLMMAMQVTKSLWGAIPL